MALNLLDRRRFLVLSGGAATTVAAGVAWTESTAAAELDPSPFTLGVASGDPTHNSVVLWTRLAPDPENGGGMPDAPVRVGWEISRDENFGRVVRRGAVIARPDSAHSVHVLVEGLPPDEWYWYRFESGGTASRVGRTRTLLVPGSEPDRMRFAIASCQAWRGGPYPAYRDMCGQDLDFVIHLGDYIYETADGSLEEFRRLHSVYKTSPDLRAAHAAFPFITTWDDHEVLNNWADDHKTSPDGLPFPERRTNAFRAYYEHLPMRTAPEGPDYPIYRRLEWGRLARFSVLDTRQYRDAQACGGGMSEPPCAEVYEPDRTMTGPEQERWVIEGLKDSKARWNVLPQQTIFASFDYDQGPGLAYNLDQWDGYPAARQRFLDAITRNRVSNPIVLSGDWHSHWVNDILADFSDPESEVIASEFVGTSIASGIGWDDAVRQGLAVNPHVKFYNGSYRGYVHFDVTPQRWLGTSRIVLDPNDAASSAYTIAAYEVRASAPGPRRLDNSDGLAGSVTDAATGAALPNVEVLARSAEGTVIVRGSTDPNGDYVAFAPPGAYTLEAHGVGYASASREVTVSEGRGVRADFALDRIVAVYAGTGFRVPGPRTESGSDDIVLGNEVLAIAVSVVSEDGQLPNATKGKPRDLAVLGRLDQLDWINLPYVADSVPTGTEAWQRGLVRAFSVEVGSAEPDRAVVRTLGEATEATVDVATTYAVELGQPWVLVESVFTNSSASAVTVWIGDVIDHDGAGQRSGVAGHGTISAPYGSPDEYPPTGPWIGMTGGDAQTYGIVYDDAEFVAYGNGNWIQSRREVMLAPGAAWTLRRRVAALATDSDPWTGLDDL